MRDKGKIAECLTDLKEILKWQKDILGYGAYIDIIDDTVSILKDCPEIVRCKDCEHGYKAEGYYKVCCIFPGHGTTVVEPNDFCSKGKKKDGNDR